MRCPCWFKRLSEELKNKLLSLLEDIASWNSREAEWIIVDFAGCIEKRRTRSLTVEIFGKKKNWKVLPPPPPHRDILSVGLLSSGNVSQTDS